MPDIYGVDLTVYQSYAGSTCATGVSFQSDSIASITPAELVVFGNVVVPQFVTALNGLQCAGVANLSAHIQARGGLTPSLDVPLTGHGVFEADTSLFMPPEFNYWLRMYTWGTYNAIGGGANTTNPIRRGGMYITGAVDSQLSNGQFIPTLAFQAARATMNTFMVSPINASGDTYSPTVIAEEIVSGTGWRSAYVSAITIPRITRLRKRMAGT